MVCLWTSNSNVKDFDEFVRLGVVQLKTHVAYAVSDLWTHLSKQKLKQQSWKWHDKAYFSIRDYPQMETSWLYYLTTISFLIYV